MYQAESRENDFYRPPTPQGVPFRETHHISGAAVKMAEDRGVRLDSLTPTDLRTLHSAFEDDVQDVWDYETRWVPYYTPREAFITWYSSLLCRIGGFNL